MNRLPQISEAEFEVMKLVWKHAPISTNEITERLVKTTDWSPKTIQTLIRRLVGKGALTYEKESRVFVYTPLVTEEEYLGQKSSSFLKRYFDGNITAMVSSYLDNVRLSASELGQLRALLAQKGDATSDRDGSTYSPCTSRSALKNNATSDRDGSTHSSCTSRSALKNNATSDRDGSGDQGG